VKSRRHGRGVVLDDVIDARLAVLDRGGGRRRGVFDVNERPDATTVPRPLAVAV
jgi:hypothetical protein